MTPFRFSFHRWEGRQGPRADIRHDETTGMVGITKPSIRSALGMWQALRLHL